MIIYKCTFPNKKVYIGQTCRELDNRLREHKKDSKNISSNKYNYSFYEAIREFGWENLIWEIIDNADNNSELDKKKSFG